MEVILLEKVSQLGDPGDLVKVKSGFGRNFLIPTGKAIRADEENKAEYEKRKDELLKAETERKEAALQEASKLESLVLNIHVPVSEEGTLYGSIGTRELTDSIAEKGINLDKSSIFDLKLPNQLIDAISLSKKKNPDLIIAKLDYEQSKKDTISARSDLAPTAKLSFDRSKSEDLSSTVDVREKVV